VPVKPKAILFDAFPVFDPRPIFALVEELFPGRRPELSNTWRARQFEYTWLRNSMADYKDFWQVTQDALIFAATSLKLDLTPEKRDCLMNAYLQLRAYPDVADSLKAMRAAGLRLAFLSNFTVKMLQTGISNSGLDGMFDHLLSTDAVRAFKPDARAYQMGVDTLKLKRHEMVFAAFAGWDAVGAKKFGYPTFWVNRMNQPSEQLGFPPDGMGGSLVDLKNFVIG
jgi:2-haloacid dehalogenase